MSAPAAATSSSTSSHPAVTESKGKLCSACSQQLSKSSFSNKQWLEPAASRRCGSCIAASSASKSAASPAPSTATASPTPAAASSASITLATSSALPLKAKAASASSPVRPSPVRSNSVLSHKPHSARPVKKNPKRPTLLDDEGDWFVQSAEAALGEVFDRFDADHDGQWSIRETQSFAIATNGKPFTTEELYEVTNHFFKDSKLPKQGFLQFYHLQTSSHPAETWKDLQKLGYNWDLQLMSAKASAAPAPAEPPPASAPS